MKLAPLRTFARIRRKLGNFGFASRIWAFPERGLVYISNPKSACTTIKAHLRALNGAPDVIDGNPHHLSKRRIRSILRTAARDNIDLDDCFVFSSVRDPLRRAVSAFNDRFAHGGRIERRLRQRYGFAEDAVLDWPLFIEHLKTTPPKDMDLHWRPQHVNLIHGQIRIDRVVRVETLQSDLEEVLLSRFSATALEALHKNAAKKKTFAARQVTLKDRLTLLRLYAADYHLYGYGNFWERLYALPHYLAYRRNPSLYLSRPLNRRRLF